MRRRFLAALSAVAALAGCPIPQPLSEYPAGTVTPPRILTGTPTRDAEGIIPVPANCPGPAPQYDLGARVFYQQPTHGIRARWFVDYRKDLQPRYTPLGDFDVPRDPDPNVLERTVPPFTFRPYEFAPAAELGIPSGAPPYASPGLVHVVELVVSNGFDPDATAEPNRTPALVPGGSTRFEIQTYRWVFVTAPVTPGCVAGEPGCVLCP